MLGISRWTGKGGSYRTIQRYFNAIISWPQAFVGFFMQHLYDPEDTYILVGDETVVTKSGKETHGLDHFFSSLVPHPFLFVFLGLSPDTQQLSVFSSFGSGLSNIVFWQ